MFLGIFQLSIIKWDIFYSLIFTYLCIYVFQNAAYLLYSILHLCPFFCCLKSCNFYIHLFRVAILLLDPSLYCLHSRRLAGAIQIQLRHLEILGYKTVVVCVVFSHVSYSLYDNQHSCVVLDFPNTFYLVYTDFTNHYLPFELQCFSFWVSANLR